MADIEQKTLKLSKVQNTKLQKKKFLKRMII